MAEQKATGEAPHFCIDLPVDWKKPARTLHLSGWCVNRNDEPFRALRAVLGKRKVSADLRLARPDVAASFPKLKTAWQSGFALALKLPPGKQTLVLEVQGRDGAWHQLVKKEVTGSASSETEEAPPPRSDAARNTMKTPSRFLYWLDLPSDWSQTRRHLHISGWCLAGSGDDVAELRARLGRKTYAASYGILRPDVAATLEIGSAASLRSGFALDAQVPWAGAKLVLEARSKEGLWEPFFQKRVRGPLLHFRHSTEIEAVGNYAEWIRLYDSLGRKEEGEIRRQIATFANQPTFSVLLPAYNSEARWLQRAIESVRKQLYPHWELCIVDDASTQPHVWPLLQRAAQREPRIKIHRRRENGHISAASNDALRLASGDFIALLDHDDELAPAALYFAALELNRRPDLQLLYSDEDKLDRQGRRCDPYFKTDWNPDLFLTQNYVSHLSIYAANLIRKVAGFREGLEGSQDYDLALRCVEQITPAQIHHIPHILYHWRIAEQSTATFAAAKPYAHEAAIRAVQEHLDRTRSVARVEPHYANYQRVIYSPPPETPLVSIIIPTRDRLPLLRQCVESIRAKTRYPNFELVVVDNDSVESDTREYLASLRETERCSVIRGEGEFNYSKLNNLGVAPARGTYLALLNNDLEISDPAWLTEMVSHAARPDIGAVGARLWYPDGRLQHGGVILGVGGVASHAHQWLRNEHGYFARAHLAQNFSAVTGACMVLRKEVYERLGGFDEAHLAVAFNDVDFCLRLRAAGLRVVWTPHANLLHHESASRGLEDTGTKQRRFLGEVAFMREKWGRALEEDPFYNPNLSIDSEQQFKLAFPPRVPKPWTVRTVGEAVSFPRRKQGKLTASPTTTTTPSSRS